MAIKESLDFDNTDFVDLGELAITTWTLSNVKYFIVNSTDFTDLKIGNNNTITKMLCSKYKSTSWENKTNKTIFTYNDGTTKRLCIRDDSYNDSDTFKNATKGVLLAYEKA